MSRRALLPSWLLLAAIGTVGCAASDPVGGKGAEENENQGRTSSAIVNGSPSPASQDAAVLITIGTDGQFCTGALIAPNLVLTARHCVQALDETMECGAFTTRFSAETLGISVGADATAANIVARGKKTYVDQGTNICSHDIALILLDKDVAGATVASVRLDKPKVGEITAAVGYGDNGFGTPTASRAQRASLKIDAIGPASQTYTTKDNQHIAFTVRDGEIATGESTCFGDSGGPLFDAQGRIIGMTSRGLDAECIDRPSIFTDTASHADLIEQAATEAGHPLPASTTHESDTTAVGDTGDDTGDGTGDTPPTKSKFKSGTTLQPQANAGCAVARTSGSETSSSWRIFGLLGIVALAARRRRL